MLTQVRIVRWTWPSGKTASRPFDIFQRHIPSSSIGQIVSQWHKRAILEISFIYLEILKSCLSRVYQTMYMTNCRKCGKCTTLFAVHHFCGPLHVLNTFHRNLVKTYLHTHLQSSKSPLVPLLSSKLISIFKCLLLPYNLLYTPNNKCITFNLNMIANNITRDE